MKDLFDFLFKGKHIFVGVLLIWLFNFIYIERIMEKQLLFPSLHLLSFMGAVSCLYLLISIFKVAGIIKKQMMVVLLIANIFFYWMCALGIGFLYYQP